MSESADIRDVGFNPLKAGRRHYGVINGAEIEMRFNPLKAGRRQEEPISRRSRESIVSIPSRRVGD